MKSKGKSVRLAVQRWRVNMIAGARAREICQTEAKSAEDAIKYAIRTYGINDQQQQSTLGAYML